MEKQRRNTLDRLQKLGFGRKSSTSSQDGKSPDKSSKTERLKELTEKLKGKSSSTQSLNASCPGTPNISPPPKAPPRRFKHSNSIDKNVPLDSPAASTLPLIDNTNSIFSSNSHYKTLPPNSSATNLERLSPCTSSVQSIDGSNISLKDDEMFTRLTRPESRTIVGSYIQKSIPFRSASFSQVDFSSGKYVKADLANLRHSMNICKDSTSMDTVTLTLPKSRPQRSSSPAMMTEECPIPIECYEPKRYPLKTELSITLQAEDNLENVEILEIPKRNSDIETIEEDPMEEMEEHKIGLINVVQASEMTLETLIEEESPVLSAASKVQPEELQTATTCLIPIPVYECVEKEWSPVPDQWIRANEREISEFELIQGAVTENFIEIRMANRNDVADMDVLRRRQKSTDYSREQSGKLSFKIKFKEKILIENLYFYCIIIGSDHLTIHQTVPDVELNDVAIKLDEITEKLKSGNSSSEDICCMVKTQIAQSQQPLILTPQKSIDSMEEIRISPEIQEVLETVAETLHEGHHFLIDKDIASLICPDPDLSSSDRGSPDEHKHESMKMESSPEPGYTNDGDFVEVRKRHSNNDGQSHSGSDKSSPNHSPNANCDEKRRIDKSRRRKGIYIQWPAIENSNDIESDSNENSTPEDPKSQWKTERTERANNKLHW